MLDTDTLQGLRDLLKECSAHIVGGNGATRGSGFFVDERLLLTCAHVVKVAKGETVMVEPYGRHERPGMVLEVLADTADDLAIVGVKPVEGERPQPAVVLDGQMRDAIEYYAVGYPRGQLTSKVGQEEIKYTGRLRRGNNKVTIDELVLEAGKGVTSGLSGGAVLSSETGAVVAVIQYATGAEKTAGGGAIPIVRAAERLPAVKERLEEPPVAARQWRDILGREGWQALGRSWEWQRRIDLWIGGTRLQWRVWVDPDDTAAYQVTYKNLPEDVSDALFQWAQRRRVHSDDEVKLLGRLLGRAMLPASVAGDIASARRSDKLLLRLRFEPGSELDDVPWEFATVPINGEEERLAIQDGMSLVRVAPHPNEAAVRTTPDKVEARVLGVVVQPVDLQPQMPVLRGSYSQIPWPEHGVLVEQLRNTVENTVETTAKLKLERIGDPTPSNIKDGARSESEPIDVVHYIGFGRLEKEAEIAVSDGEGAVDFRSLKDFFQWIQDSNARIVVVQFMLPPVGSDYEPIPPGAFVEALKNTVNAVVFTRIPMHPRQLKVFNEGFYQALAEGQAVEVAVQRGRDKASQNRLLGDAACFGWFTLLTGPKPDTRLVAGTPDPFRNKLSQEVGSREAREVARSTASLADSATFGHGHP